MSVRRVLLPLLAGVLAVAAPAAFAQTTAKPAAYDVTPGVNTAKHAVVHGMVLNPVNTPISLLAADIPRMALLDGINTLTIYVYTFVDSPTSSAVHRTALTPSDAELQAVIALAHTFGMDVILMPVPWLESPYKWRGFFQPKDVNAFFDSWRFIVNHYADLAQANGVTMLSIGSEQRSLQQYTQQWQKTAYQARQHFKGMLTYMSNLDPDVFGSKDPLDCEKTYTAQNPIDFWGSVDVISISPYFKVSDDAVPGYPEMHHRFATDAIPYLDCLSRAHHGKPVFLAEVGYTSSQYLGKDPFNPHPSNVPEPQAQADAYRAVLDALNEAHPKWLFGIEWFSWDLPKLSILDTSYTPRDKPAECILARYWGTGLVQTLAKTLPCGTGGS